MVHIVGLAFVIVALAVLTGAILQGVIGFGMVVLSFPVLVTIEPELLPGSMLLASIPLVTINLHRNYAGANVREVGWIMLGRLPGIGLAVVLLRTVDSATLAIAGGMIVLGAVALSLWAPSVSRTTPSMVGAGWVSGLFGTAIGIGGPPLGLLYQNETGPKLRSTVSVVMFFGAPLSALVLALSGDLSEADVRTGVALMPFTIAGIVLAPRFIPWFDERLKQTVLVVCAAAAVVAMAKVAIA